MTNNDIIVDVAKKYIGQREKKSNAGFLDPDFEKEMVNIGWYKGASWCAYFTKLVWSKGNQLHKYMSGGAVATYKALDLSKEYNITATPERGALVIWRNYKDGIKQNTGHSGIVTSLNADGTFNTIEGNTSTMGGREGILVDERVRKYEWTKKNGLRLLGFVNPI